MKREIILQSLNRYQQLLTSIPNDQMAFYLGICQVCLGNFAEGQKLFEKSCIAMFSHPMLWEKSSHPDWLVDICVLSGRIDLFPSVLRELESFKLGATGNSILASYAYGIMGLLCPSMDDISKWIQRLYERPKFVMWFSIGQALQSIQESDNDKLNIALANILKSHEGQATRGGLRSTAERHLCMPAMSLCYAALKRDLKVNIENDYISVDYLNFLIHHERQNLG